MEEKEHNKICIKCKKDFLWFPEETWWDYKGITPTKLVKCSFCECIQAIKYEEQVNPNIDKRYYR